MQYGQYVRRTLIGALSVAAAAMTVALLQPSPAVRAQDKTGSAGETVGAPPSVPPLPSDVTAAKAYQALERNCAGCHQAGRNEGRFGGSLNNILALPEIARQAAYVRPGLPDASRLYNVVLTRERHADLLNDPALAEATPLEVQEIRDWILDLKPLPVCTVGARLEAAGLGRVMEEALRRLEPETARLTRFATAAHLANSCVAANELAALGAAMAGLKFVALGKASGDNGGGDDAGLVWQFSLRDLGWSATDWDTRIAAYPLRDAPGLSVPPTVSAATGAALPVVAADWLLSVAREGPAETGSLARTLWRRSGDAARLAAETWLSPDVLAERLAKMPPAALLPARRLLGGDSVSRADLDLLSGLLAGRQVMVEADAARAGPLDIALWSDKSVYKAGDLATFRVTANQDCHLTLVGVDRAGRATVLFPNEFEPANLLVRGSVLPVPAADAPYRFRFKEKGTETIVAICSVHQKAPIGVHHDYERLRFTVLGDWQLFLREPTEMKDARRDDAAGDTPRPEITPGRRRGRGRAAEPRPSAAPMRSLEEQTRTAISVTIE